MEDEMRVQQSTARLSGLLYFIWILTGLYAMFYIPSQMERSEDAVTTAQNILSNEFLFRTGIVNNIISCTIWVFLVLVFYRLFRQVNEHWAKLLVALVIVQIPVVFFMEAFQMTSLMIFRGELLKTVEQTQRQDLAMLFLKISDYGVLVLEAFWGLWLFPLAMLIYRSRFLPRFLGVWLIITGIFYLVLSFTGILLPSCQKQVLNSVFALPAELGEVALMLWLLIKGVKQNIPVNELN